MTSPPPGAAPDPWDAEDDTADVEVSAGSDPAPGEAGAAAPGALATESDRARDRADHLARDSGSRNVTVLPFVESTGETIRLKPRSEARYQRVKRLGAGAMGEVDLVRDNDIGRTVALKHMASRTQNPDGIARFVEEIRTVGRLEHPNIVPIHDVGVDEAGRIFFVMKHIDGETLETVIKRLDAGDRETEARFTLDCRIEICLGVLRALQFAHARGIIHRGTAGAAPDPLHPTGATQTEPPPSFPSSRAASRFPSVIRAAAAGNVRP